jgi:hypothetical protein
MNEQHDDFLHAYREDPAADFAARLRSQLDDMGQPAPQSFARRTLDRLMPGRGGAAPRQGAWKLRLAALAAILALLFTVTPLRALATDILYQWGLITFTNNPTVPDLLAAGLTPTPQPGGGADGVIELDGVHVDDAAVLSQQVGYPMYIPQYLPADATLFDRDTAEGAPGEYAAATGYMMGDDSMLYILQRRSTPAEGEYAVGDAGVSAETVGANTAVWIEGISTSHEGNKVSRGNMLIWDADGFQFTLMSQSHNLDRAKMKAIAESMVPGE